MLVVLHDTGRHRVQGATTGLPRMTLAPVLAATAWPTNAALIADCARLGYLTCEGLTLDPTYGKGNWWTLWRPERLVAHDLDRRKGDGVDFRALPEADDTFDHVAFDPPYVSPGGRDTSTIKEMHDAFGMAETPKSPLALWIDNTRGFVEVVRVTKPGGTILYKSQDYVSSGNLQAVTHWILDDALDRGLKLVDRLEHVSGVRPQPPGRRQVHARRNLSTLFVFRKR